MGDPVNDQRPASRSNTLTKVIDDLLLMRREEARGVMVMANSDDTMFEDCIRRLKELATPLSEQQHQPSETAVLAAKRLRVAKRYSTFHDRPLPCDEITCADEILRLTRSAERPAA